jgi:peptidoglycan/xylan/chitin deacetylase (PgdA/CDA1 family)
MKTILQFQLTLLLLTGISYCGNAQFKWPNGAKAAVCLTYDDALDGQLDYAIPQLDSAGLKGTFFCTGNSPCLYRRMDEWRMAAKNGHELGNHTLFHPCLEIRPDGTKADWVKPEYNLQNYNLTQLLNELKTANTLLKAIDGKEERTFGYTCSDCTVGGIPYTDSIKNLFTAARADGPVSETMNGYNIYKTPSWGVNDNSAEELIAYINKARDKGTIAIIMFHSVGGGYLNTGAEEHRKLVEYINKNQKDFYCATFKEVMDYIRNNPK